MQIVILDGYTLNPGDLDYSVLKQFGTLSVYDRTPADQIKNRLLGADIVFTNKTPIREEHLQKANRLRYIGVLATGYDVVDVAAAARRGIPVCNVPGYGTDTVAQHVFALLLEICQNVGLHDHSVHSGRWANCPDYCYWETPLIELSGKTLGIFGCGAIGRKVASIAQAFGMEVIGCSKNQRPGFVGEYVDFDTLLARSDVLSLHCPATEETRGLINRDTIAKMKDGAILINTARGALVEEEDLAQALNDRKLYAAGLDVSVREPISPASPLLKARSCYITPHIAWASLEARQRLLNITVDNLRAFLAGAPRNRVN
ncbi:MAG: D-2-hydroxyacid dehydrogenase [Clostridia bacterium]|nr:D-2-hydroxyacid dehydrogenase [Clostridia bacterium]